MEMGDKIKSLREKAGMTLEELGQKVGVGKSTVRKWETGQIANMRRDKISKIANALDVSPAYLMGWTDNPDPKYVETLEGKLDVTGNQLKDIENNIRHQVEEALKNFDTPTEFLPENIMNLREAIGLYQKFQSASPEIRSAVEILLKSQQRDF